MNKVNNDHELGIGDQGLGGGDCGSRYTGTCSFNKIIENPPVIFAQVGSRFSSCAEA